MWNDGVVQPHPPITRGLQETVGALEQAGHTIIPWDSSLHADLIDCIGKFYFLDAGQEYFDVLRTGEEPASPLMKFLLDRADTKPCTVLDTWKVREEGSPKETPRSPCSALTDFHHPRS